MLKSMASDNKKPGLNILVNWHGFQHGNFLSIRVCAVLIRLMYKHLPIYLWDIEIPPIYLRDIENVSIYIYEMFQLSCINAHSTSVVVMNYMRTCKLVLEMYFSRIYIYMYIYIYIYIYIHIYICIYIRWKELCKLTKVNVTLHFYIALNKLLTDAFSRSSHLFWKGFIDS